MVDIEQRSLCPFEEHPLAGPNPLVEQYAGVSDVAPQFLPEVAIPLVNFFEVEGFFVENRFEIKIFFLNVALEFFTKRVFFQKIHETNPDTRDFVLISGADAAAGGADLTLAAQTLARKVNGFMIGHNHVRLLADAQLLVAAEMALSFERVNFFNQHFGVDDHAITDNAELVRVQRARRNEV